MKKIESPLIRQTLAFLFYIKLITPRATKANLINTILKVMNSKKLALLAVSLNILLLSANSAQAEMSIEITSKTEVVCNNGIGVFVACYKGLCNFMTKKELGIQKSDNSLENPLRDKPHNTGQCYLLNNEPSNERLKRAIYIFKDNPFRKPSPLDELKARIKAYTDRQNNE